MKRLLVLWLGKGPTACRISSGVKADISDHLANIARHIPKEFARKPRSMSEVERWKATEFRLFLLYTGPVVLKNRIPTEVYDNFMLLNTAIRILCSPSLHHQTDRAQTLLENFVQHFGQLYGTDLISYNVHALLHLPEEVKRYGVLDNFSSFPFENFLYQVKRMIRKPTCVLQQAVLRMSEKSRLGSKSSAEHQEVPFLVDQHAKGPLPKGEAFQPCTQYKTAKCRNFDISVAQPNNCICLGGEVVLVMNILACTSGPMVVYKAFKNVGPFFTYPVLSPALGIHEVSRLDDKLKAARLDEVCVKCLLLPLSESYVVLPLLHS
jgi:hypothetical protein